MLGAHHCPHPGAPVKVVQFIDNGSIADQVLAPHTDLGHPNPFVAQFLPDAGLGRAGIQSPQVPGRPDLGRAVLDPEVDRLFSAPGDHHRVKACHLELSPPEAAALAIADRARQRGLGRHIKARESRQGGAGYDAGSKDQ